MCASYGALESTFVSTRSTVPCTFASAAALTFDATSPLSSFSVLPLKVWPPFDGSKFFGAPCWAAGGVVAAVDDVPPDVAAPAIAAPLTAAAPTAATVTSLDLMLVIGVLLVGGLGGTPSASGPAARAMWGDP